MNLFRTSALSVCLFALAAVSPAQQVVNLKKRLLQTPHDPQAYKLGPLQRRHAGSSHYLIQFSAPPSPGQIQNLRSRGAERLADKYLRHIAQHIVAHVRKSRCVHIVCVHRKSRQSVRGESKQRGEQTDFDHHPENRRR